MAGTFEESRKAIEDAQVVKLDIVDVLGTRNLETLCRAIEQCGWTIGGRRNHGKHFQVAIQVEDTRYNLDWYKGAADKFALSLDYAVPGTLDEAVLRRKADAVDVAIWFVKTAPSIDNSSVSFRYEGIITTKGLAVTLEAARSALDAGAAHFFGWRCGNE